LEKVGGSGVLIVVPLLGLAFGKARCAGTDEGTGALFSYVRLEAQVPGKHPLRAIGEIANAAPTELSGEFAAMYVPLGRPSIPPAQPLRAPLLQAFYSIRSER
jgi:hypothetical protein